MDCLQIICYVTVCYCASVVVPMSHSFIGDDDMIIAAAVLRLHLLEVYEKYKHVCIIAHNTNRLA